MSKESLFKVKSRIPERLLARGQERNGFSQFHIPRLSSSHSPGMRSSSSSSNAAILNSKKAGSKLKGAGLKTSDGMEQLLPTAECKHFSSCGKKLGDIDGSRNPTPVHSKGFGNYQLNIDDRRHSLKSQKHPNLSVAGSNISPTTRTTCSSFKEIHNSRDKQLKYTNSTDLTSRQHVKDNPEEPSTSKACEQNPESRSSNRGKPDDSLQHTRRSLAQDNQSSLLDDFGVIHDTDALLHQEHESGLSCEENAGRCDMNGELIKGVGKENVSSVIRKPCYRATHENDHRSPTQAKDSGFYRDSEYSLTQMEDVDRPDNVSETSMVDPMSSSAISPDDVVGIIRQKRFWRARRLMVKHQKLFSLQVFELHRLIEVQKLIAGSPHLLLEYNPYLLEASEKESLAKNLPSDHMLKFPKQIVKQRDSSKNPNQSSGCGVENAVVRPHVPFDSVNKGIVDPQLRYEAFSGNPPTLPIPSNIVDPCCFRPLSGNQWLFPVMSSSEGLIYKPYAQMLPSNAGFTAPVYGGCSPVSLPPLPGAFVNPAYGVLPSHPQGIGVYSVTPPIPQTYFPPIYAPIGMPIINQSDMPLALEGSLSARARPHCHSKPLPTGEVDGYSQKPSGMSNKNNGNILSSGEDGVVQRNATSISYNMAEVVGTGHASEGRLARPLYSAEASIGSSEMPIQSQGSLKQRPEVIMVMPHNPGYATESAARIFQIIQEERQQRSSL